VNRRNLLGSIAATLFGNKLSLSGAARDSNLAASLFPLETKLKWSPGVIGNVATSEVFLKNNLQIIANSLDASIISAERTVFGVSIYIDPSGIFTNEIKKV
jgi:hypothetical protein